MIFHLCTFTEPLANDPAWCGAEEWPRTPQVEREEWWEGVAFCVDCCRKENRK